MSETALYRPALAGNQADAEVLARPGIKVTRAAPLARFVFRGDATAAGKAGGAFGASLPVAPLAANALGARAALWQGPDEWLLLACPEADGEQAVDALARKLAGEIAAALGDTPHSLVDVSERGVALLVEGAGAADLLNAHVFLDLSPEAFPVGMVTRTLFTKAEITLWRLGDEAFAIEVWRSFAPYVAGLLIEG
jgi:sarcosine oxidase subunit gamma